MFKPWEWSLPTQFDSISQAQSLKSIGSMAAALPGRQLVGRKVGRNDVGPDKPEGLAGQMPGRQVYIAGRWTARHAFKDIGGHTCRWPDRQAGRQLDRLPDRQTARQTAL